MKTENRQVTLMEVARQYFGKKYGTPTNCETCAATKDVITSGSVLFTRADKVKASEIDWTIDDTIHNRCNIDSGMMRKAITPYIDQDRRTVPASLYGHMAGNMARLFAVGMGWDLCAFYCEDPGTGFKSQDGARMESPVCGEHESRRYAYSFDGEAVAKFFRRFRVSKVSLSDGGNEGSLEFEFRFKGEEFRAVLLRSRDEVGRNGVVDGLLCEWHREDVERMADGLKRVA